jgi:hypothetical protein
MARVTAPLLSFGGSGQIAKTQVYATWKGRPYARRYVIPSNPNTADQQATRSTFSFLNSVWKFMPSTAIEAWQAYGRNSRFTDRNGFIKINLSDLIGQADLANFVFSPAASGGLAAASITVTPGNDQLQIVLAAPTLPTGWSIVNATMAVLRQQDPQTGTLFTVTAAVDSSAPYDQTITGLANAQTYVVGGWFKYLKPDGSNAYGEALMTTGLTT